MRSEYVFTIGSIVSSTGPQYRVWQRAGVANITATGRPLPMSVSSDFVCSGHTGLRVQIGWTPSGLLVVGDAARGAADPATGDAGFRFTWNTKGICLSW